MADVIERYTGMAFSALELGEITDWPDALIEDYTSLVTSLVALSDALAASTMIVGTGSPEGVATSNRSRQYYDTAGGAGSRLYLNPAIGVNTGWVTV